jgi:hypothetical protein
MQPASEVGDALADGIELDHVGIRDASTGFAILAL